MSSYRDDKDKKEFKQTKSSFSSIDFSSLQNQPLNVTASGAKQPIQTTDPSAANSSNNPQDAAAGAGRWSGAARSNMGGRQIEFEKAFGKDPIQQRREATYGRKLKKNRIKQEFRDKRKQIRKEETAKAMGQGQISLQKLRMKDARAEKKEKMKEMNSPLNYLNPNTLEVQGDAGQVEQPNRAGRPVNSNVLMNDPMNYQDPSKVSAQQNNQAQMFSGLSSSMGDNPEPMIPGQQDQSITPGQQAPFQKKAWINKAIKKPGQLHRDLGVPEGEKIPSSKLNAALAGQYGKKTKQRAALAKTLSKFKK